MFSDISQTLVEPVARLSGAAHQDSTNLRILVAIASYGNASDHYLSRVIAEYQAMSFSVDIVVLSNRAKALPLGVELHVGLPNKNPWSLPFGHKQVFANRQAGYDLFIYSEDDILITESNLKAFLWASERVGENEVPGFVLAEYTADGASSYPQAHGPFHWDVGSTKLISGERFAFFTNEHSACYVLTRLQLQKAITSGGFLVGPHEGKYDMLCSAATDPYTQCGLKKLICVSRLSDFTLHHLPNKYIGRFGVSGTTMKRQIEALSNTADESACSASLFQARTKLMGSRYSKDHYEPVREDVISAIPRSTKNILSLGCGRGATEARLVACGYRVVAVPMDPVISAGIEDSGVRLELGDLTEVREKLSGERFDCLLLLGVLHLVPDPAGLLRSFADLLSPNGVVIATVPNLARWSVALGKLRRDPRFSLLGDYDRAGVHAVSRRMTKKWATAAGLKLEKVTSRLAPSAKLAHRLSFGTTDSLLASEFLLYVRQE